MKKKQEMSSADISALISELSEGSNSIVDSKINKIYQPTPDEVRINIYIPRFGRDNLVIESGKRIHLSKHLRSNPKMPGPFPMLLRKHIMGGRITFIRQYDFDRIVEIGISKGDVDTILIAEFFSQGNVILLNNERKIILPMKPRTFRGRKIQGGEIYEYPESQISPLEAEKDDLEQAFSSSEDDVVRTIATSFNLGGLLAEEVCARAGVDKNKPVDDVTLDEISKLTDSLKDVFTPIVTGELNPCIIKQKTNNQSEHVDVLPFELEQYKNYEKEYFDSFNKALDEFFGKEVVEAERKIQESAKKEKVDIYQRRLQQQQAAIEKFEKEVNKYNSIAEAIYAHYPLVEEVLTVLTNARKSGYSWDDIKSKLREADNIPSAKLIQSIDPKSGTIVMDLDGTKTTLDIRYSVPQNAQTYYEKAKRVMKKREGALRAIEETKRIMENRDKPQQQTRKRKVIRKKHWYTRFRWFISSDGFLVVGGRDADTNEEIFKKYMEKQDIVLHTQVPGAPLAIVKSKRYNVPEQTMYEVAQFVVSYSSIWKSGQFSGDCYWVYPNQVSKTPESGEFLKKGSFIIRGARNYFKNVPVSVAIGLELENETRVIGGPLDAVKKNGKYIIELMPGKYSQSDLAKKIYKLYMEQLKDVHFVKNIASPDQISNMLPPGESDIKDRKDF
ncbi:ribosome rescue protein RqcH [Methanohalobium sp.]|uniref:ribosome rescue protein RqcH n=1 Tax=Methanohalobium sp. TaxID=2837493 RepID=UPI0025E82E39|nr:ribosome rescue protein RqcH [Methanohalobium sp.]